MENPRVTSEEPVVLAWMLVVVVDAVRVVVAVMVVGVVVVAAVRMVLVERPDYSNHLLGIALGRRFLPHLIDNQLIFLDPYWIRRSQSVRHRYCLHSCSHYDH